MTTATAAMSKPQAATRNGVDTEKLFATINFVREQPEMAKFQFRATTRWVRGTHARTTISDFYGAGSELSHKQAFTVAADHPEALVGDDNGPTPVEYVLHALGVCLTAGIGNIASARGVALEEVEARITGDVDLRGVLGLSNAVRNGFRQINVSFRVRGDASPEKLAEIVEQSKARSAVYDILTNGVPVAIEVDAG